MTAPATYVNVRRHLAKRFPLSRMATGRRSGQQWTEGATVQARRSGDGVIVHYRERHGTWSGDAAAGEKKLAEIRAHLAERWHVSDYPGGRLHVTDRNGDA